MNEENLSSRKKTSHKKKTKKNSVVFDCDLRSLGEFNATTSLRAKQFQNTTQNVKTLTPGQQEKYQANMISVEQEQKQSRANSKGGGKSARSFTQYKDFQVEKDRKNMTTNFTHGPDAMQGMQSDKRRVDQVPGNKLQNLQYDH